MGVVSEPFGTILRGLRERAALTQEQLAERAGLSVKAISALERGERRHPYPHTVRALGAALGLSSAECVALQARVPPRAPRPKVAEVRQVAEVRPMRVVCTQVQGFSQVIGRDEELDALRAAFTTPRRTQRPVLRVLTGLGGVGKTSLARAYAERYQEQYELIWWVRAEDRAAVADEFRALLDILAPQHAEHSHDPVQAVHALLANRAGAWLLVIDNIAEPQALRGLLPAAGAGDVLVTSRAGNWPDRRIVLPVPPLAEPDAVRLVTELSGDDDRASAAVLVQELGGLPLALAQAGSYVAHNALDLASYLALYRRRRADLHREGRAPDYPATVATTWKLAFDQLSAGARAVLTLLAWYAPDAIPLDRLLTPGAPGREHIELPALPEPVEELLRPLLADEVHRHRVLAELVGYGLLTRPGPGGSVTVHRLVQAVTADQLTTGRDRSAWIDAAAALLEAACPAPPPTKVTIHAWQSLQTHVRAIIDHLHPDQPISLHLRHLLADWTGATGDFGRARELAAAVVTDMIRVLGADDRRTLTSRMHLSYWTGEAGDILGACALAGAVAQDMTRVFGPEDVQTLYALGNFAVWIGKSGDVVRARDLTAAVVETGRRVGAYREAQIAQNHLVRWTGEAGDVAGARALAAAAVEDAQRVRGPDDRETLAARARLVRWTGEAGDVALARALAAALVEDDERMLGPEHRHTLIARAELVRWTGKAGDLASAQELATALLADLLRIFGPDHRYTRAVQLLARWTQGPDPGREPPG